jgi:hypothetical protein
MKLEKRVAELPRFENYPKRGKMMAARSLRCQFGASSLIWISFSASLLARISHAQRKSRDTVSLEG